jgi:SPP1 gp7 family putative phage head morphogenesis protein
MPNLNIGFLFGLKPERVSEYLKQKGYTSSWNWRELWQKAHHKSFTVAKVTRLDVLQDIKGMVQKAIDEGITLEQFKKELTPKLKAKGWWGDKEMINPNTKLPEVVELGSPYRLETIYRTNVDVSYSVGNYAEMIENVDNRPYWQYDSVMDARTRPEHALLNGKIFRYDDPFWNSFYPPNDWRCRCSVRALTPDQVKNKTVESGKLSYKNEKLNKKSNKSVKVGVYTDPKTGKSVSPKPEWSYHVGKTAYKPDLSHYDDDIRKLF